MPLSALAAAVMLIAAQQPTPPIGQRTVVPERVLEGLGLAPDAAAEDAAIAAAQSRPLGTMENPVRVGGPAGQRAYIARLRCGDGSSPRVGQRENLGIGAFGTIVDGYSLDCGAAAPGRFTLVLDMYHDEHREHRAPAGFTITPLPAE